MRKAYLWLLLTLAALTSAAAGQAESPAVAGGAFTYRGTVTHVVDGDTLDVRLTSGTTERIRVIGIDTPERGVCYFSQATARARQLAMSKQVVLRGDATQDTRDRYGRLLAYVWLPGGKDLGYQLVVGGFAKVYVYRNPFQRLSAYRSAGATAKGASAGQWKACAATPAPAPAPAPAPLLRQAPVTRPIRHAFRSSATSTAPTSARWVSRPFASSDRIRTGSMVTTTDWAASRAQLGWLVW